MNIFKKTTGALMAFALAFAASSCDNSFSEPNGPGTWAGGKVAPMKAPSVYAWSGETALGVAAPSTRAASYEDLRQNDNFFKIRDFSEKSEWMRENYPDLYRYYDNAPSTTDREEFVSQAEFEHVMAYIAAHPDEGGTKCDLTDYFIQNVGTSGKTYSVDYLDDAGSVHHSQEVKGGEKMNYLTIGTSHVPDYNASYGNRALILGVPAVDPTYSDSYGDLEQRKSDAYKFYFIEYEGKTAAYICFDYRTKKYDNGMCDYAGDGVYDDWVIKLIPADGSDASKPAEGGQTGPDQPEQPGVNPGQPEQPDQPEQPGQGGEAWTPANEVEINLSVLDSHDDYRIEDLVSKLSIHVRAATDVEVFLPVPARFYCAEDDLSVVLSHQGLDEAYGAESVATYEIIPGHAVTVTVTFEEDGIRVRTDGIDQEIVDWCAETYGDGVNFEIWNYFNNEVELGEGLYSNAITRAELKELLDRSTVKFLDLEPELYVNAFNKTEDGGKFGGDCVVTPSSDHQGAFADPYEGWHLNGSPYNELYENLSAKPAE